MKFVKYPEGHMREMVHEENLFRKNLDTHRKNMTQAELDMYRGYEDRVRIEDVYWDEEEQTVVALIVDYFGALLYARYPTWAAYYEAMLNHLLGPIQ
jgi:hypothetical protein